MVLLGNALSTVAEQVTEVEAAMNAVALGPMERRTVQITFLADVVVAGPVSIADLLEWVRGVATEEDATSSTRAGGGAYRAQLLPTIENLQRLTEGASRAENTHTGFTRERVRRSLREPGRADWHRRAPDRGAVSRGAK